MDDSILRLYQAVLDARAGEPGFPRTAKLLADGLPKMAKKVAEEALEVGMDAVRGDREAVVLESADLVYNLVVIWADMGIRPEEVWREMERRENLYGIAEKLPKASGAGKGAKVAGRINGNSATSSAAPKDQRSTLACRALQGLRRSLRWTWQRVFRP
jgi:phosphoribosyl-ATP pyrophosphohydrolase